MSAPGVHAQGRGQGRPAAQETGAGQPARSSAPAEGTAEGTAPAPSARGRLWLMPNALDGIGPQAPQTPLTAALPDAVLQRAAQLRHWAVEDARSARAFLKRVALSHPLQQALQEIEIRELPRPRKGQPAGGAADADAAEWAALLAPAQAGHDLGLLSEAGLPAVADPGARLVEAAHRAGIPVHPMAGASALLLALAASGFNGQRFAFVGYVPQAPEERAARLAELEAESAARDQTQLMIEAPYRNAALWAALLQALQPQTRLSVSQGLTTPGAHTATQTVAGWQRSGWAPSNASPAVFALWAPPGAGQGRALRPVGPAPGARKGAMGGAGGAALEAGLKAGSKAGSTSRDGGRPRRR